MGETDNNSPRESSFRLKLGFETTGKLRYRHISLIGTENLTQYPEKHMVLATTHISDMDIPTVAAALASRLDLGFANISAQNLKNDAVTAINIALLGKENFFPLDYMLTNRQWQPGKFNPDNYTRMVEAMKKGKTIMVAAHNPSYDLVLPKGGYGAIWLAHQADAILVPVAVNIHVDPEYVGKPNAGLNSMLLWNYPRPDVDVNIGNPLILQPLAENNTLSEVNITQIRAESNVLMRSLASMLPPEKQGMWAITNTPT